MTELWSSGKSYEDVKDWETRHLSHSVFYLFEDIQLLNKRIAKLEAENAELRKNNTHAGLRTVYQKAVAERNEARLQLERCHEFIKGHIKKWEGARELQPSLQVLARVLHKPGGGE